MHHETIDIPAGDGVTDAFLVRPDEGSHPGVLLCMDAFGLRPQISAMADRIAAEGYVVLAPNLFHRHGRTPLVDLPDPVTPDARATAIDTIMPMMAALTPEVVRKDASDYLDALKALPDVTGPVGATGYCMGGTFAFRAATALPDRLAAVATFHAGHLATRADDSPHLAADRIRAELYHAHADADPSMPAEDIARLEKALDATGVAYTSESYHEAAHGFTMADMPEYDAEADRRHWGALLNLLAAMARSPARNENE